MCVCVHVCPKRKYTPSSNFNRTAYPTHFKKPLIWGSYIICAMDKVRICQSGWWYDNPPIHFFFQLGQSGTLDVRATLTNPSASCWPLDGPIFENNVNEPCCGMWPRYQEKMGMQSNDVFLLQPICRLLGVNIPKSSGRTPWGGDWWLLVLWVSKTSRGPHPITADMTVAVERDSTDSFTSIHKYICLL